MHMKLMFIIFPVIYLLANGYLYWKSLQVLALLPLWIRVLFSILFWTLAFSLFASMSFRSTSIPSSVLSFMYKAGSVWMVFLLYSVLLLICADIVGIFFPSVHPAMKFVFPVACCILLYGYLNYRSPRVRQVEVSLNKSLDCEMLTAVGISDVHLGFGTGPKALERYVRLINEHKPDVIFIAGDLIDNSIKPIVSQPFAEVLAKLEAPLGIYMVPGNHEYISDVDVCAGYLKKYTEIHLLRDNIVTLPCGLQIVGRDDRTNKRREPLKDLLLKTDADRPVIVLDHQPYGLAETDSLGVDIHFSGHTHRGQVWPLTLLVDRMYEQSHGYRKWKHSHIFVSSGLSLWGPPFRIGSNSDMFVMKIK